MGDVFQLHDAAERMFLRQDDLPLLSVVPRAWPGDQVVVVGIEGGGAVAGRVGLLLELPERGQLRGVALRDHVGNGPGRAEVQAQVEFIGAVAIVGRDAGGIVGPGFGDHGLGAGREQRPLCRHGH